MNEHAEELIHRLCEELSAELHVAVSQKLQAYTPQVREAVREQLGEQFRFWG
jgi:hypothetical protein